MSNCATDFAFSNEEQVFAKKELSCGTLIFPGVSDRIFASGNITPGQNQEFQPDPQIRAGASRLSPLKGRLNVGDMTINTMIKPSGTLGTAPEHHVLFECMMGVEDPTPLTKVEYTLADQLDSFSLWIKKGHTVFAFRGCVIQGADIDINGTAFGAIGWRVQFMEQLYAGTCEASDTCGISKETITLASKGSQRYTVGMYVKVGTDDNAAAGYEITEVNYTNDTIKISPVLATDQGVNPTIYPFLPTANAEVGEPVHGKLGYVTINSIPTIITAAKISIVNNIKFYDDEKNNVWTAERFGRPTVREIKGSLDLYFVKAGPSYIYRAAYQISDALIISCGNVAGKIMKITIPYAEYETPQISGDAEFKEGVPFNAIASAALNDEIAISFE